MPFSSWNLLLLGDLRLVRGDDPDVAPRFESRKVAALLARLALAPHRLHAREELAALLWPDADRRTGLERLRHCLSSLNRLLSDGPRTGAPLDADPYLFIDRSTVRINADRFWCDATAFEMLTRRGPRFDGARDLYKGELLPGFYDDWICEERDRLQALFESLPEPETEDEPKPEPLSAPLSAPMIAPPRPLLPSYLTRFFGRERERDELAELLRSRRLVTLLGPGGGGKTRLAVEAARDFAASDPAATVLFVPLAECVDPAQIPDRVRAVLRLPPTGDVWEQLDLALGDAPVLLVLDNLEQLASGGAGDVVEALLAALPGAVCLATSRNLLGVVGEQAFPLPPLPTTGSAPNPSVALFVDRARASRPDFAVTERNRDDLDALCRLLEGIPLALELAAARIRVHTVAEMRRQIADEGRRFALVARPEIPGRKEPRHASLRAAVAWSWRLLTPRQQDFLAALSVLRGRWTAEVAAAVCDTGDALPLLEALASSSLILVDDIGSESSRTGFRLLETIRAFAAEQLSPDARGALHRRHAAVVLETLTDPHARANLDVDDLPWLESALENALGDHETDAALALCIAFEPLWLRIGEGAPALTLVRRALELPGGDPAHRVRALDLAVYLTKTTLDIALGRQLAAEAEALAGSDPALVAIARLAQARARYRGGGDDSVAALLDEAVRLARESGDTRTEASALNLSGLLANRREDYAAAENLLSAAQALREAQGDPINANLIRVNRGIVANESGDPARAQALLEDALHAARALGDLNQINKIQNNLGTVYAATGRWSDARAAFADALVGARRAGYRYGIVLALWNLAEPLTFLGETTRAVRLLAFADRHWTENGTALARVDVVYRDRLRARFDADLGPENVARLWRDGIALSLNDAVSLR